MYWPCAIAQRKRNYATQAGVPLPDYFDDLIIVMPFIDGGRAKEKHKTPPLPEFYGIIQFLYEWGARPIFAMGNSRGAMWLEHAIQEKPHAFKSVIIVGSYANTTNNALVMGEALHVTLVRLFANLSASDYFCGVDAQRQYWSCIKTASGVRSRPGSLLKLYFLDKWSHEEFGYFSCPCNCKDDIKVAIIQSIMTELLRPVT